MPGVRNVGTTEAASEAGIPPSLKLWTREDRKQAFLPKEPIHKYFYQLGQHCDPEIATTGFADWFEPFWRKSSQVPLLEAFTHKIGFFQSCLIVANRVILVKLTGISPTNHMGRSPANITVTARQCPALPFPTVIDALRKSRIALAPAFAHNLPMLARVLSAALSRHSLAWETTAEVNGIEIFPVEVEVNCGWGDTLIVLIMSFSPIPRPALKLPEIQPFSIVAKRWNDAGMI
jgi:hypothetical protein